MIFYEAKTLSRRYRSFLYTVWFAKDNSARFRCKSIEFVVVTYICILTSSLCKYLTYINYAPYGGPERMSHIPRGFRQILLGVPEESPC